MAVDWTEVGYVVAGAILTSVLRGEVRKVIETKAPAPAPTQTPTRPESCVRMPRFVEHNGTCHDVVEDVATESLWCDQQEKVPGDDDFFWPWSHPACR